MAATITVPHRLPTRVSSAGDNTSLINESEIVPRHGVITLWGYGISVSVDKGHLILRDGIGDERRAGRFARVNHGIRRLIVIGADGNVSLAALRWLADQDASFVMLERNGKVLLTTGPVAASDARLRRKQSCVQHESHGIDIVRELIRLKLTGQETVAREKLDNPENADRIAQFRQSLDDANTFDLIRVLESHGAAEYWEAWQGLEIRFPQADLTRVPDHWRVFDNRRSPISGTPRKPTNPVNTILNYLYTILETETRLAVVALGLDPGLGLLHVDQPTRDSLLYDLMEPIRPRIDEYLLGWVQRTPLKRSWFFEQRDGSCRLMASLTEQLSETASMWGQEIAPIVEWFAHAVSMSSSGKAGVRAPGTRLTQQNRYTARGMEVPAPRKARRRQGVCSVCGGVAASNASLCPDCARAESGKRLAVASEKGRIAAGSPEALQKISDRMKQQRSAIAKWNPADLPEWLTDECFSTKIWPALGNFSKQAIAHVLGVSKEYAYRVV